MYIFDWFEVVGFCSAVPTRPGFTQAARASSAGAMLSFASVRVLR